MPCAEWVSLFHLLDPPFLSRTSQPRLTTLAFAHTPKCSRQCPRSRHSFAYSFVVPAPLRPSSSYCQSICPFTVSFHSCPIPNSHSLGGPPRANLARGLACGRGVPDAQHPTTPLPTSFSRTLTLCPQNTPTHTPEPSPASKDQVASKSGRDPALGEKHRSQVAGESGAPSVSRTLAAREGGQRQEGCWEGEGHGGLRLRRQSAGPEWPKFGAPPSPPSVREPRARGRGGFGPIMNQEQKEPRE